MDCESCHLDERPDPHYEGGCVECHTPFGWGDVVYDHGSFPLVQSHDDLDCMDCHSEDTFSGLSTTCESCHTRPDGHFPGECDDCHSLAGWEGAGIDHSFFPLTASHDVECLDCHEEDTYEGLDPTCESCHTRPTGHFPGQCDDCHTTTTWNNGTFDHSFFPLTNSHNTECLDCHQEDTYEGLNPTCESCHTRPSGHFQGECSTCHDTKDWDANFNHNPFFPTPHEGVSQCSSCHTTGSYQTFECIECHEHNKNDMDDEHDEENNYQWKSSRCLDCHPDGEED
jgi:hypothetical protein